MKIGPLDSPPSASPVAGDRKQTATTSANGSTSGSAEPSATVALSSGATLLGTESTEGSFDGAKVSKIAQAIQKGQYTINAEVIADKLISNAQERLGMSSN